MTRRERARETLRVQHEPKVARADLTRMQHDAEKGRGEDRRHAAEKLAALWWAVRS